MKKILLVFYLTFCSSVLQINAAGPRNHAVMFRNSIIIYEAIGQMDCPVYRTDNHSGTIEYKWYKKIRKFGNESPATTPFREAKCEYINGFLNMYFPSDRSFVYRFFWEGDVLTKIETYFSPSGNDACKRYYNYELPHYDNYDLVVNVDKKYFESTHTETEYSFNTGNKSGAYPIAMGVRKTWYKKGKYDDSTYSSIGLVYEDGRLRINHNLNPRQRHPWNLLSLSDSFEIRGRNDSDDNYYGVPFNTDNYYLYETKYENK